MPLHGDQASLNGLLVTIVVGPLVEATMWVSGPALPFDPLNRDQSPPVRLPPLTDTLMYGVQRDAEDHVWLVHEEDLRLIPTGDHLAQLVWDASEPPARKETAE